ncbi:MAG: ABC transporter ATP-binding protein [Anaerofustis sp.]
MIKKLFPYTERFRKPMVLTPIFICIEVVLEIMIPFMMSKIVDIGIANSDISYVLKIGSVMVGAAVVSLIFGMLASKMSAEASMGFGSEVRKNIFYKIQDFAFSNVDRFTPASLVTRSTTDITNLQNAYMMMLRIFFRAPIMMIMATYMAFTINASLVKIFLVAIPILAISLAAVSASAHPKFTAMFRKYDKLNSSIQENLVAIRVVKSFVRAIHEKEKFDESNEELMQCSLKAQKLVILTMPVMQFIMYASIIAILWFGGRMIVAGTMLTGELISFISYVSQILMSLMMLSMVFIMMVMSKASAERVVEVLADVPDIQDAPTEVSPQLKDASVIFRNVSFRYGSESESDVLCGIDLEIHAGETIGIIGATGSAKTSLVQLIPRLYDVTGGELIVGGHNVKEYHTDMLRNSVSMVLQKNELFSGTIRENMRWGNPDASDEQIEQACRDAQAHDFILTFPDGYDTELGQGGVNVSGGQKQRLCIARALLKNPKILILDDSTSAVDTATDAKIRDALKKRMHDATTIIIAQRIVSVCEADRIIVMDEGKINDVGTHEELLARNEIYRDVYTSQQKGVA